MGRDDDTKLFVSYVPPEDWPRLARELRRDFADFFRIDLHAQGYESGPAFLVVATVPSGDAVWTEAFLLDAQAVLHSAIDNLTTKLRIKVFFTSRGWKLAEDTPEMPVEWERDHGIPGSPSTHRGILSHHEIDWETKYGGGPNWGWQADEFTCSDDKWVIVKADLEAGCILGLEWDTGEDTAAAVGGPSLAEEQAFLSG